MIQQHCHNGNVHGAAFPAPQHAVHGGHPLPSAGFTQGMSSVYKAPTEPLYGSQVPFQSYIPGPGIATEIFTQPLPCEDNAWSHGSSHSCNMPAHGSAMQPMTGSASMSTLNSMGHGSMLHGPHVGLQGHSSSLSNPGSLAHPNASFPPPGLAHCSVPRPPPQAPWPHLQSRVSANGTLASTTTSGVSTDVRLNPSLQQHSAPSSPPLPIGFQYASKGSRQLLVHFAVTSHGEISSLNSYMSGMTSQLDGLESCTPIPSMNHTLAVCTASNLLWRVCTNAEDVCVRPG